MGYAMCKQKQVLYSAIRQPILLVVHMYVKRGTWDGMNRGMDPWNGLMEWMTCKKLGAFKEYCGIARAIL